MPDSGPSYLRIYCLCGQKMKVSAKMYGLPGKCVACRLKIRIPRPDEIPEGTDEVYLKDHPEWVRKRRKPKLSKPAPAEVEMERPHPAVEHESEKDIVLGEEIEERQAEPADAYPIDVLESLRTLCSLQWKIERELAKQDNLLLEESQQEAEAQLHELLRYQARARRARSDLDEQLRQRLMEAAIELSSTQEKIGETALAVRVGEITFTAYRERIVKLRERRERLERRQQNLRGWLAVTDPALAGGYVDLPLDAIPGENAAFSIPMPSEGGPALLNALVDALRDGLHRREQAERSLAETADLERDGTLSGRQLEAVRRGYEAEKTLANSSVRFFRERLGQLKADYRRDLEAVEAQMDLLRGRAKLGELNRAQYESAERELLRAKSDCAKALDMTQRTLSANVAQDVPHPRGTFLARINKGRSDLAMTPDVWLAWAAALSMAISLFLPALAGTSLLGAYQDALWRAGGAQWGLLLPLLSAVLVALAATVPNRSLRGLVMLGLWLAVTLCGIFFVHGLNFSPTVFAERFREAGPWYHMPALLLLALGSAAFLGAAIIAVARDKVLWPVLPAAGIVFVAGAVGIVTDGAGWYRANPYVLVDRRSSDTDKQAYAITLGDSGRRPLYLLSSMGRQRVPLRNGYVLVLERKVGQASWGEVSSYRSQGETGATARGVSDAVVLAVHPGQSHEFIAPLEPGEYRVVLRSPATSRELIEPFTVAEQTPSAEPVSTPSESAPQSDQPTPNAQDTSQAGTDSEPSGVAVELRGIVTGDKREPLFSLGLYFYDGRTAQEQVTLNDTVYDNWTVQEYNPDRQTVTLSNGSQILTVRRGQRVALP